MGPASRATAGADHGVQRRDTGLLLVVRGHARPPDPAPVSRPGFVLLPSRRDLTVTVGGAAFSCRGDMHGVALVLSPGSLVASVGEIACGEWTACFFKDGYLGRIDATAFPGAPAETRVRLCPVPAALRDDVGRLFLEAVTASPAGLLAVESLGRMVAIDFLRALHGAAAASADETTCAHPGILRALRAIHERYEQPHTVAGLAAEAGLSVSRFMVLFRKATGSTPHEELRCARVKAAANLLESGADVTSACFAVGFESLSGFEEAFRSCTGMSPHEAMHRRPR